MKKKAALSASLARQALKKERAADAEGETMKRIGLVQINNSFADSAYFPYSVGLFQAYYQAHGAHRADVDFIEPIFERLPVEKALRHLQDCDLAAFSVYSWNFTLSMRIAEALKAAGSPALVAVGGPQIPPDTAAFLERHPAVDIACRGEGERTVTDIIDHLFDGDFSGIPAISRREDGRILTSSDFARETNLDEIPSPYLTGVFDPLLKAYPDKQWLGLWETNRGCPFSCAFCDWGAPEQRKMYRFPPQRARDELRWFAEHRVEFVCCCDSNFGLFEQDVDYARYAAELKATLGYPHAISVQNAKNATQRVIEIQETLNEAGMQRGVTLALQSVSPEVMRHIGRKNISLEHFSTLQHTFSQKGVPTYTDIILCLPGETRASFVEGIDSIVRNGQYNRIQFINLSVLPNSRLADPETMRRFGLETVDSLCMNIHGAATDDHAVAERQQLVIASAAMPREDWRTVRAWSWMCSFLFFDKLLQIPLALLMHGDDRHEGQPLSRLVDAFMQADGCPLLAEIADFFREQAAIIQNGGAEYVHAPDYLDISWFQDEYQFIRLADRQQVDAFYAEAGEILRAFAPEDEERLAEALRLNRAMMKIYGEDEESTLSASWNVWEQFRGLVTGQPCAPAAGERVYRIHRAPNWDSFDDWMLKMVWRCNKPGAYWWPVSTEKHEDKA